MKQELNRLFLIAWYLALMVPSGLVRAGVPSRPNAPVTSMRTQKSALPAAALPTAASPIKGQVGGATSSNQKSIGSLGGPTVNANTPPNTVKKDSAQQGSASAVGKAAVTQK